MHAKTNVSNGMLARKFKIECSRAEDASARKKTESFERQYGHLIYLIGPILQYSQKYYSKFRFVQKTSFNNFKRTEKHAFRSAARPFRKSRTAATTKYDGSTMLPIGESMCAECFDTKPHERQQCSQPCNQLHGRLQIGPRGQLCSRS